MISRSAIHGWIIDELRKLNKVEIAMSIHWYLLSLEVRHYKPTHLF